MKPLKMKIIAAIGLSKFSPRWVKVLCLQHTMNQIETGFKNLFADFDASKITQEQRDEVNALIAKMNMARGERGKPQ